MKLKYMYVPAELFINATNHLTNDNITLLIFIPPEAPVGGLVPEELPLETLGFPPPLTMASATLPRPLLRILFRLEKKPVPPSIIFLVMPQKVSNERGSFSI